MSVLTYKVGRCLLQEKLYAADMTQQELADLMGVTKQQINKYAKENQGMSMKTAKNIAHFLNCNSEDLYEWEWIEVGNNE